MKFPWQPRKRGGSWPEIKVGFKRNGKILPFDTMVLVDTGADSTVLNLGLAASFGFKLSDLEEERCTVVGGLVSLYVPNPHELLEIQIGRSWLVLPALKFAKDQTPSLLGRDLIVRYFELRMIAGEVEFIPLAKARKP